MRGPPVDPEEDTVPVDSWFVLVGLGVILLLVGLFFFLSKGGVATPPRNRSSRHRGRQGTAGAGGPTRH